MENFCRTGQNTDNNVTRRMRIACWIHKATNTHSEYVILNAFPLKNGYMNAPKFCVRRALPVSLVLESKHRICFGIAVDTSLLCPTKIRRDADKSLARLTSQYRRTESIVSLERGVC